MNEIAPEARKKAHILAREARKRRAHGGPTIVKGAPELLTPAAPANETREPDLIWNEIADRARKGEDPAMLVPDAHRQLLAREAEIRAAMDKAARAKIVAIAEQRASLGKDIQQDPSTLVELQAALAALHTVETREIFPPLVASDDDAANLPPEEPMPWVVQGLELARGRPTLIVGYAGAAKSVIALAAARDMAIGRPIWGAVDLRPARPLRVLYLDLDLGATTTRSRLRRIMAAVDSDFATARAERAGLLGVPDDGRPMLQVGYRSNHRDLELRSVDPTEIDRFRAAWARVVTGFDVVVVDTLFAAETGINENATEAAIPMIVWAEVSERTGAAFLVLRHDGKPPPTGQRAANHRGRGSSAIDGAAFSKFVLELENPDDPPAEHRRKMTHAIARTGAAREPFYLMLRGFEPAPLDVVHRTAEQTIAAVEAKASTKIDPLDAKILSTLTTMAKRGRYPSTTELREHMGVRPATTGARVGALLSRGVLFQEKHKLRISPDAAPCSRCAGTGAHMGGTCFRCGGSAVDPNP